MYVIPCRWTMTGTSYVCNADNLQDAVKQMSICLPLPSRRSLIRSSMQVNCGEEELMLLNGWRPEELEALSNMSIPALTALVETREDDDAAVVTANNKVIKAARVRQYLSDRYGNDHEDQEPPVDSDIRALAERILVENGIDQEEAPTVLQALGYILLNKELYPEALDAEKKGA